ncbi:NADH:ubiquinone reductase (Na(+)-transporting) subunit C [Rhodocytophaga rosea]|uniref:Na(+)-translocating NADH-quinone reductase subunit C n=1 Tax=Rhodocytophaga rosea TaxID=2704465 RepID=A0A6C0GQ73_9BACT|nr:NADH:ubiquinone reductase (Na(+)-transporting) subunit C [Rhodocytophaga rosea]QHT70077.1 NADH:ubiquinone reductase (Na(+)-transporting) subunit C [Rhodocytophaga rosea]
MRQSNLYIILYTAGLTVLCGVLLAVAAEGLKPQQQANIALEQKRNILTTVLTLDENANITELYEKRVKAYVVKPDGSVDEGKKVEEISIVDEYKKPADQRLLPIYEVVSESDPNKAEFYVLPVYGYGLWNNIWGFVSLKSDLSTINGVSYAHAGETPGLGARITTEEIQQRYTGKKIFEGSNLVSVQMMKGEGNDYSDSPHKVDGMSGATLTAKGINNMLMDYFKSYENFFKAKMNNKQAINLK